jgi:hypothetical protein
MKENITAIIGILNASDRASAGVCSDENGLKSRVVDSTGECNAFGKLSARRQIRRTIGQERHFALQKNSEPFRYRTTVKSVTDLPAGA